MKKITLIAIAVLLFSGCIKEEQEKQREQFSFGLNFNPSEYNNWSFGTPSFSGTLPSSFDLSSQMPPIGSQGTQGSCVSWAMAYCVKSFQEKKDFEKQGYDNSIIFSPSYLHNQITNKNTCFGAHFGDALDILKNQGVCRINEMEYNENSCSVDPNTSQRDSASNFKIKDFERVDVAKQSDIKKYLVDEIPVIFGVAVDENFEIAAKNNGNEFIWRANNTVEKGGHAMVIVGYDDNLRAYKVQNSWGTRWGNNGYCWIDYTWFAQKAAVAFIMIDEVSNKNNNSGGGGNGAKIRVTSTNPSNTKIGQSNNGTITIHNDGDKDLTFDAISFTGNTEFEIIGNVSYNPILPNNYRTFTYKFTPKEIKTYNIAAVVVGHNASSGTNSTNIIAVGEGNSIGNIYPSPSLNTWMGCNWSQSFHNGFYESHQFGNYNYFGVITNEFKIRITSINKSNGEIRCEISECGTGNLLAYNNATVKIGWVESSNGANKMNNAIGTGAISSGQNISITAQYPFVNSSSGDIRIFCWIKMPNEDMYCTGEYNLVW